MNSKYSYGAVNLLFKLPFYLTCGDTWSPRALPVSMAVLTEMKLRRKISKRLEIKNKTKQTEKNKQTREIGLKKKERERAFCLYLMSSALPSVLLHISGVISLPGRGNQNKDGFQREVHRTLDIILLLFC